MDIHQALDDMERLRLAIQAQATELFRADALDADHHALAEVGALLAGARVHAAGAVASLSVALDPAQPRADFLVVFVAAWRSALRLQVLAYELHEKGLPLVPALYRGHVLEMADAGGRLRWLDAVDKQLQRLDEPGALFDAADLQDLGLAQAVGYTEWLPLAEAMRVLVQARALGEPTAPAAGLPH